MRLKSRRSPRPRRVRGRAAPRGRGVATMGGLDARRPLARAIRRALAGWIARGVSAAVGRARDYDAATHSSAPLVGASRPVSSKVARRRTDCPTGSEVLAALRATRASRNMLVAVSKSNATRRRALLGWLCERDEPLMRSAPKPGCPHAQLRVCLGNGTPQLPKTTQKSPQEHARTQPPVAWPKIHHGVLRGAEHSLPPPPRWGRGGDVAATRRRRCGRRGGDATNVPRRRDAFKRRPRPRSQVRVAALRHPQRPGGPGLRLRGALRRRARVLVAARNSRPFGYGDGTLAYPRRGRGVAETSPRRRSVSADDPRRVRGVAGIRPRRRSVSADDPRRGSRRRDPFLATLYYRA